MSNCNTLRKWMPAALDGELDARQQARLDEHVATCATCSGEMEQTARLLSMVSSLGAEREVPARVEYATLRAIRQLPADDGLPWWRAWLGWPMPALAALAVVTVVAIRVLQAPPVVYERALGKDRPSVAVARAPQHERRRLVASRPTQPLPALEQAPDVFAELEMLRNLEKMRHFDAIQTTTLDDEADPVPAERRDDG